MQYAQKSQLLTTSSSHILRLMTRSQKVVKWKGGFHMLSQLHISSQVLRICQYL
jgi:hypothetical protein